MAPGMLAMAKPAPAPIRVPGHNISATRLQQMFDLRQALGERQPRQQASPDARQRIDLSHLQGSEQRRRHALQAGTAPYVYETVDDIQRRQTTLSHQGDWAWGQTRVSAYRAQLDRDNRRDRGEASFQG